MCYKCVRTNFAKSPLYFLHFDFLNNLVMTLLRPTRIYFSFSSAMIILAFLVAACNGSKTTSPEAKLAFSRVIPKPVSANATGKTFFINGKTTIVAESSGDLQNVAGYLAETLKSVTGLDVKSASTADDGAIVLSLSGAASNLGDEGYELAIEEKQLKITANKPAGIFHGIQTLRQIIADKDEKATRDEWEIGTGTITDYPEYAWRGSMLDVGRHFFSVEDVKRYIDMLSYYKVNIFHLHLSDDQGWRIEIKSWPNLTAVGSKNEVGGGKGGFYTQEQYKDIVAYAQSRFITVVPEIDMPGHINAALVSYPELVPGPPIKLEKGERPRPVAGKVHTGIDVGFSTLSLKKPTTLKFINDVIREISEMTPGPYFHVGGDEAAVTAKPDYINFVNEFKKIVNANGKIMVGWEETAQGNVDSTAIVQYWHSAEYAKMAADKGAKVLFSPSKRVYLDMQYDSTSRIGFNWAAYIELDSSYMWDPATLVPGIERENIIGIEAPLWTETVLNMDDIEYLSFPRLPGVAEIGWTATSARNWDDYKGRVANHAKMWKGMGIDFYRSKKVQWADEAQAPAQ
jgi:hexosaminidase